MITSWLIGSREIEEQEYEIDGAPQVIPAGTYYLYDPSAPSICDVIETALGGSLYLTKDRKIRIYKAGPNFTMTLTDDMQDILGFTTSNLSGSNEYIGTQVSTIFWSPGRVASSKIVRIDYTGRTVHNTIVGVGDDGTPCATTHGSRVFNQFFFRYVDVDRIYYGTLETQISAGTYERFHKEVLVRQYPFKIYREVEEIEGSTDLATGIGGTNLGPYAMTPKGRTPDAAAERSNGFSLADTRWDVDLDVYVRTELT